MTHVELSDANRLAVLRGLHILDTPAEPAYDDIAGLAAVCCRSAIAAVNFVDEDRHWTKAIVGVESGQGTSVAADVSFCAATVATESGLLNVPDTAASEDWQTHPLVAGDEVRFYAGASIVVAGEPVGVVCVFGDEPRRLTEQEQQALIALAGQASAQLELRRRNAELHELAVQDPLTRLANRTLLIDRLELAIAHRARCGAQVGVLYCDVDDFKLVNDRLGHDAGDRLLCLIADRLRAATSVTDTVARFAGDEFVVVCPQVATAEEFAALVDRVLRIVHAPDAEADTSAWARVSIGSALVEDGDAAADVLRRADAAMYRVKHGSAAALRT